MLSKHHRDSPPLAKASRWNLSKFVVIKYLRESLNVQPSCCLDVVAYMLNCVFWRHILLEIEFKSLACVAGALGGGFGTGKVWNGGS